MNRLESIAQVELGDTPWAYARGYWRLVRVVAKARTRLTVAYTVSAGRGERQFIRQDVPLERLRWDRPPHLYGILDVPAPPAEAC